MKIMSSTSVTAPFVFTKPLRVVAFDCDGVLFDSKDANVHLYNHILAQVGHPPVRPDQFEFIHMNTVRESLRFLTGGGPLFETTWDIARKLDFGRFYHRLRIEPDIVETLKLCRASFRTAIATNRTVSALDVLRYFGIVDYFDCVVSATDVEHPKPHPEEMQKILRAFDVTPEEVLFIGDSTIDQDFARASGVVFAAYKNPALDADIHLGHFRELHPVLHAQAEAGQLAKPGNGAS